MIKSFIWTDYKHPIAFWGNFRKGLKKYLDFLEFLNTLPETDSKQILKFIDDTKVFFNTYPDKKSIKLLLEPGEIFDSNGKDINQQVDDLYNEIIHISDDIREILKQKPVDLFKRDKNQFWIWELQKNINILKPIWQKVCFYSFNKTN